MNTYKNNLEINKTLKTMKQVYSPKYGLANKLVILDLDQTIVSDTYNSYTIGSNIPMFYTEVKNTKNKTWSGGGVALTRNKSLVKSYGEFIERYCANNSENDHNIKVIYGSYSNLKKKITASILVT